MRKSLLTLALIGLLALPVLAQFRGFQMDAAGLLGQKAVQDELKLDKDQMKLVTEATEARGKAFAKAREDGDFSGFAKIQEDYTKAMKKVVEKLSDKQATRLMQIETQQAVKGKNPAIFANERLQKALGLSSSKKDKIKETLASLEKDVKGITDDAKGDFQKLRGAFQKVREKNEEAYTKITKDIDAKDLEKAQGEKFDLPNPFGKFGKDKKKKEKKKEDF